MIILTFLSLVIPLTQIRLPFSRPISMQDGWLNKQLDAVNKQYALFNIMFEHYLQFHNWMQGRV